MNRTKLLAIAGGAVAALTVGALALNGNAREEAPESAAIAIAETRDLEVVAEAAGLVEPIRVVEVKSKASGEVQEIHVETGDQIRAGALLAAIDPRDVQSSLEQASADIESARVQRATAEAHRKRMETLRESGVVTQQEFESAVQSEASARAALVRAETNLRLSRERRNDVTIRAPIAGTIIERTVEPGQIIASATSNVSGGTTLFRMADLSEMQVRAKVDETDIGRVQPGQPVDVTVEAYPGRSFEGRVMKIEPQAVVEQNVTMFPVLIRLQNPGGLLKPGMNAEVSIEIASRRNAVTVPNAAIVGMRDLRSAADAVGVDEEAVRAAMRSGGAPAGGDSAAVRQGAGPSEDCSRIFERMRSAGGPSALGEADRAKMSECRRQFAGARGGRGGAAQRGEQSSGPRPGLVFVQGAAGPEPRRVMLGVNDWEYTEIASGLEAGERVVLVSVAKMQQSQREMSDRIRERTGGPIPGGRRGR